MLECDAIWSFVGKKSNKQWIWLAMEAATRRIVGVFVGRRDAGGAQGLRDSLPATYRQEAICYTDAWEAYTAAIPDAQQRRVDKASGLTHHIERLNNTLRQRISRLVRKTLSFSKKQTNHVGAIWNFIHHYNASLPV